MTNFLRAVRVALRNRGTLLGIILTSLCVGALWGANISVVYPFIEVVFERKSLQGSVRANVEQAEKTIAKLQADKTRLERSGREDDETLRAIDYVTVELGAERKALARWLWVEPYVKAYLPQGPFHALLLIVAILLVGTLIKDFFIVLNMILVERIAQLTMFDLRKQFFRETLALDLATLDKSGNSNLLSHFTYDLNSLTRGLTTLFGQALREPLKMAACLIGASLISWRLLLFSLIIAPLAGFLMQKLAQSIKRANRRAMEEMSLIYRNLTETFNGVVTVKVFTMEQYERNRFNQSAKEFYRKAMRIVFYNSLTKPITELLGIGVISMALIAGVYLVLNKETHLMGIRMSDRPLSPAALMLFYGLLAGVSDPARKISNIFALLQTGFAGADRVFPLMDRVPAITEPSQPRQVNRPHRRIAIEGLSFQYKPDEMVLRDIDLEIKFGETIAIVGPNGCGKSTLIKLIPRLYDPVQGAIRLDDVDIREMRTEDLRGRIGLVSQQTHLFNDTVMNNIRYGSPRATADEVIEAAKKAHADKFIRERLTNGYETVVGDGGGRLSGGQRQRVALARAILRDPEILILDEATSQIDIESEQLIQRALSKFVQGRTAIIVTHRLSTISLADRVVVIDAGEVRDIGTHQELLDRCRVYARLHDIHFNRSA